MRHRLWPWHTSFAVQPFNAKNAKKTRSWRGNLPDLSSGGIAVRRHLIAAVGTLALNIGAAPLALAAPAASESATPAADVVTSHVGTFGGRKVAYSAIAGETILKDAKDAPAASLYSFTYLEKSPKNPATRPVIFVFNGGPGSASIWLHFGMLGPRQIDFPDPVRPPTAAPFKLRDNPQSLLDVADIVFIDPIGTGFSKLLPGGKGEDYFGVSQDARATAEFIEAWLTRHNRWNSPKFLIGESYGTVRASVLANTLMGGVMPPNGSLRAISLNGVAILGPSFMGGGGAERSGGTVLPTMAAVAWKHGKIDNKGQSVEQAVAAAQSFAREDYVPAIFAGSSLPVPERARLADRLAQLTGIPARTWLERDLKISLGEFGKLLLKDEGLALGDYDARYTLPLAGASSDPVIDDPAMGQYTPGFVTGFNQYLRDELKVTPPGRYVPIAWTDVNFRWDWNSGGMSQGRDYAQDIAAAMRRNPQLKLFIGVGYYDLVTTLGAAEYSMNHAPIAPERLTFKTYESGHMPYLGNESAPKLGADMRAFIRSAIPN